MGESVTPGQQRVLVQAALMPNRDATLRFWIGQDAGQQPPHLGA